MPKRNQLNSKHPNSKSSRSSQTSSEHPSPNQPDSEQKRFPPSLIRRVLKIGVRIIGALIVLTVVLVGLFVWRLSSGPVSVGFLTSYIEKIFAESVSGYLIDIHDTILVWDRDEDSLSLEVREIALLDSADELLAKVPAADVKLGFKSLLHGVLALREIRIEGAWVGLIRDSEGQLHFGLFADEPAELDTTAIPKPTEEMAAGDTTSVLGQIFGAVMASPDPSRPLTYLQMVSLTGAELSVDDRRSDFTWRASQVDLLLERSDTGLGGDLSFAVPLVQHAVEVQASLEYLKAEGVVGFDISFANLWLPDLGEATGVERLTAVDVLCSGSCTLETNRRDQVRNFMFEFTGEPLDSAGAGPTLTAKGHSEETAEGAVIDGEVTIAGFPIQRLPDYWPVMLAPGAREWITRNISSGMVTKLQTDIELFLPTGSMKSLQTRHFIGELEYENLMVHFFRPLPPIRGLTGSGTFDLDRFDLRTGRADLADLEIDDVQVAITGLSNKQDALAANLSLQGPLQTVVALLDNPSLDLVSAFGLVPEKTSGTVTTLADIKVPLRGAITLNDVGMNFEGHLRDGEITDVFQDHDLTDSDLDFTVKNEGMTLNGPVNFAGIPLRIDWYEAFSSRGNHRRKLHLNSVSLDEYGLQNLGLDVSEYLTGPLAVDLKATFAHEGHGTLAVDLDLLKADLSLPYLKRYKQSGKPGMARASLGLMGMRPVSVDSFRVEAGSLATAGRARFDSTTSKLVLLDLDHVALGRTKLRDIVIQRDIQNDSGEDTPKNQYSWQVKIGGDVFDAEPLLAPPDIVSNAEDLPGDETKQEISTDSVTGAEAADAMGENSATEAKSKPTLSCSVDSLSRVYFAEDRYLQDVKIRLERDAQAWNLVTLSALTQDMTHDGSEAQTGDVATEAREVSLRYGPSDEGKRTLFIKAVNVGDVLRAVNVYDNIDSGGLAVRGRSTQPDSNLPLEAQIRVRDLVLTETSLVGQLLNFAWLKGLLNPEYKNTLTYDRLACDLVLDRGVVTVSSLQISSQSLGITGRGTVDYASGEIDWHGTVIPLKKINTFLGRIPLLGRILSRGEGLVATDYTVTGSLDSPNFSVQPLSTVTPDFLRDIFKSFDE